MPHLFSIKHIKSMFFSSTAPENTPFITPKPPATSKPSITPEPSVAPEPPVSQDDLQRALEKLKTKLARSIELEDEAHREGRTVALRLAQGQSEGYRLQIEEMKKKFSPSLMMKAIQKAKSLHF
ncbi:hypothetical protein CVT25_007996 [Psilocybe cyanescens]|uniref:Uncharacterized protein n=1 Tax=Psilocybe cyanescens TaxID=93625 RepID=A0A409XTB0_PSICY|nr:hypothetical protein CVT25_007996 [Psilocybe cyanescens]